MKSFSKIMRYSLYNFYKALTSMKLHSQTRQHLKLFLNRLRTPKFKIKILSFSESNLSNHFFHSSKIAILELAICKNMNMIIRFLLNGLAVVLTAYLLPGVDVTDYWTALIVALVLAIVNVIVKPILVILTIPITILTLGLFLLVINALIILLVDYFVDGFIVNGFWWALLFSLILSLFNSLFNDLLKDKNN